MWIKLNEVANLLFELYPDIQKAYNLTQNLQTSLRKQPIK